MLSLTNTSDGGYFAPQYCNATEVFNFGHMIFVPIFGTEGIILLLGVSGYINYSSPGQYISGVGTFNTITMYDLHTQSWL